MSFLVPALESVLVPVEELVLVSVVELVLVQVVELVLDHHKRWAGMQNMCKLTMYNFHKKKKDPTRWSGRGRLVGDR